MLVRQRDILHEANVGGFSVPAFNISDFAMAKGIVAVSEREHAPVLLAIHPDEVSHLGPDVFPALIRMADRASVPVGIHWDHGASADEALQAIQYGFTSVMIDGSLLPFEENVAVTRKVVEAAHAVGLFVEAELGTIGVADNAGESGAATIIYTDPDDAVTFVEQTGCDSLAVAIGTSHGLYPPEVKPELRLDLLAEIRSRVSVPLVLHGGSSNPDEEIAKAVQRGISKINISSDIKVAYHEKMREILADPTVREPNVIQPPCVEAMQQVASHKIHLMRAAGRAADYSRG